jgi:hypothetical protein
MPSPERLLSIERLIAMVGGMQIVMLACSTNRSTVALATAGHRQGA